MTRDLTVNTIHDDKHCLDCKLLKFRKNLSQLCRSKLKLVDDHKTQPTDIRVDRNSLSSSVGSNVDHNSDETGSCGFEPHRVRDFSLCPCGRISFLAQKVLFGIFIQHSNTPHLNHYSNKFSVLLSVCLNVSVVPNKVLRRH